MPPKMTLKGRFLRTGISMVLLSVAVGLVVALVVLSVFIVRVPDGGALLIDSVRAFFGGEVVERRTLLPYVLLGGILLCLAVGIVCMLLTSRLAAQVGAPLRTLKRAADDLQAGELDFEVLSCEYRELDDLCQAFESARKRLKASAIAEEQARQEREQLMANLSHDLRTPVTAIKGYVEGLRDGIANTPEKQRHYLDTIYAKSLVLEKLVREMTELSECGLGRMRYHCEYVDLMPFLRDVSEEYEGEAALAGLTFTSDLPGGTFRAVADRDKLKRVLDNLFSNAVKYSRPGGQIHLTAEGYEGGIVLQLADDGKGISHEALHHVFDRFFREDTARTSSVPGSGLGLAICRSIMDSHHGKIWLTSEQGEGTRVFLYLPLVRDIGPL